MLRLPGGGISRLEAVAEDPPVRRYAARLEAASVTEEEAPWCETLIGN